MIDRIYDNSCDYQFIMEVGEPYDGMGVEPARTFYNLTKNAENIVHLKRNDEFELYGLKFEIFNACIEMLLSKIS